MSALSLKSRCAVACLVLAALEQPSMYAPAAYAGVTSTTAAELRRSTQSLLDAIAIGDVVVWDRLLDERAIQVDENDVVRTKKDILTALKPLGPGLEGHLKIDDFRLIERGDTAVVTHEDDEFLDYHGQILRSRFRMTDTWVRSSAGWRQVASMVLAVLKDPPVRELDKKVMCSYEGRYELTVEIQGFVRCERDELLFERPGQPNHHFLPELLDVFFEPGKPRTRRVFERDAAGNIAGFVDRREGRDVTWHRIDN